MKESESEKFIWKSTKNIAIFASIAGGTAVSAIILYIYRMMFASDNSLSELTNVFTFAIEIGIGVFVSIMIFQYSRFQQSRSDNILNEIKAVHEDLASERTVRKEIYQKALINCFSSIWMKCKLIMLNLDLHKASEDLRIKPTDHEEYKLLVDMIEMNKTQISLDLQQLQTLVVLLGHDLDSKMITSLLDFHKQSFDNIKQTGIVREYFPASIEEFKFKELEGLMPEEYKDEIKKGRTSSTAK